jgi:hypothetical protein
MDHVVVMLNVSSEDDMWKLYEVFNCTTGKTVKVVTEELEAKVYAISFTGEQLDYKLLGECYTNAGNRA